MSEEIILVGNVHQLVLMMGLGFKFKYFRANWKVCEGHALTPVILRQTLLLSIHQLKLVRTLKDRM